MPAFTCINANLFILLKKNNNTIINIHIKILFSKIDQSLSVLNIYRQKWQWRLLLSIPTCRSHRYNTDTDRRRAAQVHDTKIGRTELVYTMRYTVAPHSMISQAAKALESELIRHGSDTFNINFPTWLLIDWQQNCQPIRSHVWK